MEKLTILSLIFFYCSQYSWTQFNTALYRQMYHNLTSKPIKRYFIIISVTISSISRVPGTRIVGTNEPTEKPIIYDRIGWFRHGLRYSATRTGLFCSILRLTSSPTVCKAVLINIFFFHYRSMSYKKQEVEIKLFIDAMECCGVVKYSVSIDNLWLLMRLVDFWMGSC